MGEDFGHSRISLNKIPQPLVFFILFSVVDIISLVLLQGG